MFPTLHTALCLTVPLLVLLLLLVCALHGLLPAGWRHKVTQALFLEVHQDLAISSYGI